MISSSEGIQQGDPLSPLLFCLGIHPLITKLQCTFKVFCLDDGTLGGCENKVYEDFQLIQREAALLGLNLNHEKTELISDTRAGSLLLACAPNLCRTDPREATLLGSPISDSDSFSSAILKKIHNLKTLGSRLPVLDGHDAILLMKHSLAIPKILYILRTALSFLSSTLAAFERELQCLLSEVLNINFVNYAVWTQATLPVKYGGIGLRSAVQLAPCAFLASAAACTNRITTILPSSSPAHQLNIAG